MYPAEAPLTIWERGEWMADDWDQNAAGLEYDWDKPFIKQYKELMARAPVPSRSIVQAVNSDYSNNCSYIKDCYLTFGSSYIENGAYLENNVRVKDSLDVSFMLDSQLSYECFFSLKCYNALYSSYCEDCHDIYFCRDCTGCSDCFGCVGLRGKSYYIFNQPYSKEEYEKRFRDINVESHKKREELKKQVAEFWLRYPVRYAKNFKNSNSTGEYITNSKNVQKSYYVDGGENLRYCQGLYVKPNRDSYDHYRHGDNSELMYECAVSGGHSASMRFCYHVFTNCREIEYSWNCNGSSNLFGCVGLHQKQYCILNKQYTKAEYEEIIPRIKKHMDEMPYVDAKGRVYKYGEFFPSEIAIVPYNKSVAMEYFPLSKENALAQGYVWGEPERKDYSTTLSPGDVPDNISGVTDGILSEVIGCEHEGACNHGCTKAFRIVPQELQLYKRMNIPLPHRCPNCRFFERIKQRNPVRLSHRVCRCAGAKSENGVYQNTAKHFHENGHCPNEFETSYSPERKEIVYCEQCYQAEVV